jgi:protein SCO1/2
MRSKSSRIILLISMLILGVVIALLANRHLAQSRWESAPAELKPLLWPEPRALPDFSMREQSGKPFSAEDFKGQWSLLFFGYLQCPDVCPMTLQSMKTLRALMRESGQTGGIPRMVFVSVDPANDTPERMAGYLAFFDDSLIGLSGSADQLEALAGPLGIAYAENRESAACRRHAQHGSLDLDHCHRCAGARGGGIAITASTRRDAAPVQLAARLSWRVNTRAPAPAGNDDRAEQKHGTALMQGSQPHRHHPQQGADAQRYLDERHQQERKA